MKCINTAFSNHNNPIMKITLLIMMILVLPTLLMPYLWINLRSVHVSTDRVGAIVVTADRKIITSFYGDFSVTVRDKMGGFICQGAPTKPFMYNSKVSKVTPENPKANLAIMSLEKWLGGRADLEECVRQGMEDDVFTINTCHMKIVFGLPIARRCVMSELFGVVKIG